MMKKLLSYTAFSLTLGLLLMACDKPKESCNKVCSASPALNHEYASIPENLQGTYELVFYHFNSEEESPFEDQEKIGFVVKAGEMVVTYKNTCVTIDNPYIWVDDNGNQNGGEWYFTEDCVFGKDYYKGLTFGISANSDEEFNEINVMYGDEDDDNSLIFIGQCNY